MKVYLTRVLAAIAVVSVGAAAVIYSTKIEKTNFATRWDNAVSDLEKVHPEIPQEKLQARAVEILRSITVAKEDEATVNSEAKASAAACAALNPTQMDQNTCK